MHCVKCSFCVCTYVLTILFLFLLYYVYNFSNNNINNKRTKVNKNNVQAEFKYLGPQLKFFLKTSLTVKIDIFHITERCTKFNFFMKMSYYSRSCPRSISCTLLIHVFTFTHVSRNKWQTYEHCLLIPIKSLTASTHDGPTGGGFAALAQHTCTHWDEDGRSSMWPAYCLGRTLLAVICWDL